jgi:hypothetical protein
MAEEAADTPQRWTAKRRALVLPAVVSDLRERSPWAPGCSSPHRGDLRVALTSAARQWWAACVAQGVMRYKTLALVARARNWPGLTRRRLVGFQVSTGGRRLRRLRPD